MFPLLLDARPGISRKEKCARAIGRSESHDEFLGRHGCFTRCLTQCGARTPQRPLINGITRHPERQLMPIARELRRPKECVKAGRLTHEGGAKSGKHAKGDRPSGRPAPAFYCA